MTESTLRVGFVFPELLGTYGDRGNAVVLVQRARWRGIPAELVEVPAGAPVPDSLDVYLLGGGEDDPMHLASAGLRASRPAIARAVAGGAVVLAVCGGFQLVGHRYVAADGTELEGIGLVDLDTRAGPTRLIGEVVVDPTPPLPRLTGFENHWGRTTLGPGVAPLGRVVTGGGNGDGAGVEGALAGRVVGTYLHGPVLPRNPALADYLLGVAVGGDGALAPLDARLEERLHADRLRAGSARGVRRWWQERLLARG
ncbi:MAG TPA: glutamine amidotransferase [Acidimicrobiia bacterium]|nr:glutamine amidotransferase [Acidimicrobiia bacterium]